MTARELAEALIGHFKYNPFESISGRLVAVEKAIEQYGRERWNAAIYEAVNLCKSREKELVAAANKAELAGRIDEADHGFGEATELDCMAIGIRALKDEAKS